MQLTTNYKLRKPDGTDNVDINDFNYNADIIDNTIKTHTHTKSQITDMPTKLSQFTNDAGYIKSTDSVATQSHTHANKSVLDNIIQSLVDKWNSAYTHISDAVKHITSAERTLWNTVSNKLDKSGDTMTGTLSIKKSGDNETLLTFDTERPWSFKQGNTGAGSSLDLVSSSGDKSFRVLNVDKTKGLDVHTTPTKTEVRIDGNKVYHAGDKPTKADIGLSNVDNTSDANKPISTATQNALNGKLDKSGGTLTGNVTFSGDNELSWIRNTDYAKIKFNNTSDSDTDSYMEFKTGDNGNEYFKFNQVNGSTTTELMTIKSDHLRFKGNKVYHEGNKPTKADIGLSNVDNTSDANKPISTATQNALNGKANSNHNHDDRYYTESEIDGKVSTLNSSISGKVSPTGTIVANRVPIFSDTTGKVIKDSGFTIGASVPSDAKFTDTNTWRGVQDNLTSTLTDQSLSANQGKVLKGLIDGKANSNHTHDDRYYTENEIDNKLGGKVPTSSNSSITVQADADSSSTSEYISLRAGGNELKIISSAGGSSPAKTNNVFYNGNALYHTGHKPSKGDVGLGNVDNTSDLNKPISTATQTALNGKANVSHTHTKSQITDMPTKLSQFTNDAGFITQAQVDTSQNHTHSNKSVLDGITSAKITEWNGKANSNHTHNNYVTLKRFDSSHTGTENHNKWTKIANLKVTGRYQDVNALFFIHETSHGGGATRHGMIFCRLKQQEEMGSSPNLQLRLFNESGMTAEQIKMVVVSNTTSETVVEIYYKIYGTHSIVNGKVLEQAGGGAVNVFSSQPLITNLPTGTTNGAYRKAFTWNDLKGV